MFRKLFKHVFNMFGCVFMQKKFTPCTMDSRELNETKKAPNIQKTSLTTRKKKPSKLNSNMFGQKLRFKEEHQPQIELLVSDEK